MRGDLEVLNLLLGIHIAHDVQDNSKKLPTECFDMEWANLELLQRHSTCAGTPKIGIEYIEYIY